MITYVPYESELSVSGKEFDATQVSTELLPTSANNNLEQQNRAQTGHYERVARGQVGSG